MTDVEKLIGKLRAQAMYWARNHAEVNAALCTNAADTLAAQAARIQGLEEGLRRTDDHLHGMARQDWTTETLAIFYENERLLRLALVSPPLGGDLSARELRSDASAATTVRSGVEDGAATRARGEPLPVLCETATILHETLEGLCKESDDRRLWTATAHAYVLANDLPHIDAPAWQPIESAPKDGTNFLAWRDGGDFPLVCYQEPEMFGVRECRDGDQLWPQPTHWMPLPSPSPLSIPGDQKEEFGTLPASDSCADDSLPTNKPATVRPGSEIS